MTEVKKNKGFLRAWFGEGVQGKVISLLVLGLVVMSGASGYFYGQVQVLKSGVLGATDQPVGQGSGGQGQPTAAAPSQPERPTSVSDEVWKELLVDPVAVKGSEKAKVVVVEFTDYQCPFCKRHFDQTDGQIQENYVETGKVKYVLRDLPLPFHGNAHKAAQAARCAGDQNRYWEMHDKLFEQQDEWSSGNAEELFSGYAADLGLNVGTFEGCLSSEKYKQAVDDDLALASKAGASGTPTFVINGKLLVGAQPYSAFETAIEEQL